MEKVIKKNDVKENWYTIEQTAASEILFDLLCEIFKTKTNLIFKGGTALSFIYKSNRFSEDLDFQSETIDDFSLIDGTIENFAQKYDFKIINDWENEIADISPKFRRYFLTFKYDNLEIDVIIDYSIAKLHKPPISVYFSNGNSISNVVVMNPEEMLAEKVETIYNRNKERDLYDLYYLSVIKKYKISRSLIFDKFEENFELKNNNVRYSFSTFKQKIENYRNIWAGLKPFVRNFEQFKFDKIKDEVLDAFRNI